MTTIPHTLELTDLPIKQLRSHPHNPRTFLGDLSELAASILRGGIQSPLIVTKDLDSKAATARFVVIAGHRRLAAAAQAGLKSVPCLVRDDLNTEQAQLEAMLVENVQRIDLSPIEEGDAYQQLLEFPGYTMKRITEQTGRAPSTVRDRIKLAKLPKGARDRIHDGQITLADAAAFILAADHDDLIAQLEKAVGTRDWAYQVQRTKDRIAGRKEYAAAVKSLAVAGVATVESAEAAAEVLGLENQWEIHTVRCDYARGMPSAVDHQDCPGRLVVLDPDRGIIYELCAQPELHRPPADEATGQEPAGGDADIIGGQIPGQVTVDQAIEETEEQLERRRVREDLATARTVRRAHLARVFVAADPGVALAALRDINTAAAICDEAYIVASPQLAELLGITGIDGDLGDWQATYLATVAAASLPQLAILTHLAVNLDLDDGLSHSGTPWTLGFDPGDWSERWLTALTDVYGYEWSQIELDMLAKHNPEASATEPDVDE